MQSQGASYEAAQTLEVRDGRDGSNGITDEDDLGPHVLDTISIELPADVVAAGGWLFTIGDFQNDDIVLTAYDALDQVMGSVTLLTAPGSVFRFVGLVSDDPIARVEFQSTGEGGDPNPDDFTLDDFSVEIAASGPLAAPLLAPWQLGLLGAGLVLLASASISSWRRSTGRRTP